MDPVPNDGSLDITGLSADALAELDRQLAAFGMEQGATQTIRPRDPAAPTPASFSQELLWMLDRATPGLTAYNLPSALRLKGKLEVPALEKALSLIAERHEAFRTRFAEAAGHPVQVIDPPGPVPVEQVDLSSLPASEREAAARREVSARVRTPIDLAHQHSFRVTLLRLAADDHVLLIESHHIVADGWSMSLAFRELDAAYTAFRAGRVPELPPVPIQPGDIAVWERQRLAGPRLDELLEFWREQLGSAADEPLALPADFPRSATPTFAGARETAVLSMEQLEAVKRFAQGQNATLYLTLLTAFATVLHRYTGRRNVLVGSGSAGRALPETQGVVGYINSTLVQRADFTGDPTFAELLARVRAGAVAAYDHQDIPLEKLVLELRQGQEQLASAPLFEVVLTMQDTGGGAPALDGLTVDYFGMDFGATKFDLTLLPAEREGQLGLMLAYRSELFTPATIRRLLGHLIQVLEAAIRSPETPVSKIPLLTDAERSQLSTWNDTTLDEGPAGTVVELFEAEAARVGGRVAVVAPSAANPAAGTMHLTYAELNARANQLARQLRSLGVGAGAPVGLLLDRSAEAIVALVGILKAGGAYLPLPVDAPAARLAQQLGDSGARVVVTSAALAERLPASLTVVALDRDASALRALPDGNLDPIATPESLAYVLYTSGSTGTPKGVAVTHANIVHYARAISRVLGGSEPSEGHGCHYGLASTLAADLGNTCLFPALLSGATLHVLGKDVTTEPPRFTEYVAAHRLDVLKITPSHFQALAAGKTGAELAALLPSQWLVFGGEALRPELARTVLSAGQCRVLNHYGPTETTVGVCSFDVTRESLNDAIALGAQTVPLGRPLANTRLNVVDPHGNEQPVGIPGDLLIGGDGVAPGYFRQPELTAERFVPFRGERVYRTGDRVRRLADGTLEFLGRTDDQVKVRGFRVELGEIQQALLSHPGVSLGAVVLRADDGTEPRLVAYAVPKQSGYAVSHSDRPTAETLSDWLTAQLPEYMVPTVVILERLPLKPNGKVDTAVLPAPEASPAAEAKYVAPRTPTEQSLVVIWQDVLKKERVGITDSFVDLGGHSLLAIRVLGKISKAFGVRLPLRTLFDAPTVAQLAELIQVETQLAVLDHLTAEQQPSREHGT